LESWLLWFRVGFRSRGPFSIFVLVRCGCVDIIGGGLQGVRFGKKKRVLILVTFFARDSKDNRLSFQSTYAL